MKDRIIKSELELTAQELAQQRENLNDICKLADEGFFTTRVEERAVEQGFSINETGIVYEGGGNG